MFGELTSLQNVPYIQFNIEEPVSISSSTYNTMLYRVSNYAKALKSLGIKLSVNPWNGTVVKMVTQSFRDDLTHNASTLPDFLLVLAESLSEAISTFDLKEICSWAGALRAVSLFDSIENTCLMLTNRGETGTERRVRETTPEITPNLCNSKNRHAISRVLTLSHSKLLK